MKRHLGFIFTISAAAMFSSCADPTASYLQKEYNKQAAAMNEWEHQEQQRDQQRRQAYLAAHADLLPEIKTAITRGELAIGMSQQDVIASQGPLVVEVSKTVTAYGVSEVWRCHGNYLYFQNGTLERWETHAY